MKNLLSYLSLLLVSVMIITGCKKMDSTYEEHIVPGGNVYAGKANKAKAQSGKNRVRISWPRGSDPNVIKAIISWNNFQDSVVLDIPAAVDSISYTVENLEEKSYSFMIYTFDNKGNRSVPVELITAAYGDTYISSLLNRGIVTNKLNAAGNIVNIGWAGSDITNGAFATEVVYTNNNGTSVTKTVPSTVAATTITDFKPGGSYKFRTLYRPDSLSIDVFTTPYTENQEFIYDKSEWKILAYSTQHDDGVNAVRNVIDGTDGTRWHSAAGPSRYPHFVTIDMGAEKTLTRFGVWRTTFENGGDTRAPDKIEFLISSDNITYTSLGIFNFNRLINGEQVFPMANKPKGRYFKFVAVAGPENNMVLGEISAYGF